MDSFLRVPTFIYWVERSGWVALLQTCRDWRVAIVSILETECGPFHAALISGCLIELKRGHQRLVIQMRGDRVEVERHSDCLWIESGHWQLVPIAACVLLFASLCDYYTLVNCDQFALVTRSDFIARQCHVLVCSCAPRPYPCCLTEGKLLQRVVAYIDETPRFVRLYNAAVRCGICDHIWNHPEAKLRWFGRSILAHDEAAAAWDAFGHTGTTAAFIFHKLRSVVLHPEALVRSPQ